MNSIWQQASLPLHQQHNHHAFDKRQSQSQAQSSLVSNTMTGASSAGEHMMGTTIIGISYNGGVVLGADSRTSTGSYVANRVSDKITEIHDKIYVCRSGSAADTQAVSDIVRYYLESHSIELGYARIPRVKSAAHLFRELCYTNKDRLMAGMIVGGYDSIDGGSIYSIPLGGSLIKQKFAVGGSGSTYIFGLIDSAWKDGMSRDEAEALVKKALSHAMARDGSSGGVIRMVTLDKDQEVQRVMIPGDKLDYLP